MTLAIEAWVDSTDPGLRSVVIDDDKTATLPGAWHTFRQWLAAIQAAIQAEGANFAVGYSAATNRVTISQITGSATGFEFASDSMARLLGWETATDTFTPALVHTAPNPPGGLVQIGGWTLTGATSGRRVSAEDWGFSRARNGAFGAGVEYELTIDLEYEAARRWMEGPCSGGRVRLGPLAASAPISAAVPAGYIEGSWVEIRRADTRLPVGLWSQARCRILAGPLPATSGPFAPLARGYSMALRALVEGVGEYTEQDDLIISDRASFVARMDRESGGLGGSQLRVGIADGEPFERPTLKATLTAETAHDDTALLVDDTAGWPSSGVLYVGLERCTYTGTTSTTFTGVTRGVPAYGYSPSAPLGWATVTDRPLQWPGRIVRLWVDYLDAYGRRRPDVSVTLWTGEVAASPAYDSGAWWLDCEDISRRLSRPIGAESDAQTAPASRWYGLQKGPLVGIPKTARIFWRVIGPSSFDEIESATALDLLYDLTETASPGYAWVAHGVLIDAICARARKLAATSPHDLVKPFVVGYSKDGPLWSVTLEAQKVGAFPGDGTVQIGPVQIADGSPWPGLSAPILVSAGSLAKGPGAKWTQTSAALDGRAVDSVALVSEAEWSSPGVVAFEGEQGLEVGTHTESHADAGRVYLSGLARGLSGSAPADITEEGVAAYQYLSLGGTVGEQVGQIAQSSGYGDRGPLDTLPLGYALESDLVDVQGLQATPVTALALKTAVAPGASLEEHLGGLLASQGYALGWVRGSGGERLLSVRSFVPFGIPTMTLRDGDVQAERGPAIEEVNPAPNTVTLTPATLGGIERRATRVLIAEARIAEGVRETEYTLPATTSPMAAYLMRIWGAAAIALRRGVVVYRCGVTPAKDWLPGQIVDVDIDHPAVSVDGLGVILEASRRLDGGCDISLMLRADGLDVAPLCPTGRVLSLASLTLTVTDTIGLVVGETVRIYRAGVDGEYEDAEVTAVGSGTVTVDAVQGWVSSSVAGGWVYITYPDEPDCSPRQALYVHVEDGSQWL